MLVNYWEQIGYWWARVLHVIWWSFWEFWCYGVAREPPKRNLCLWYVRSCLLLLKEIQTFWVGVSCWGSKCNPQTYVFPCRFFYKYFRKIEHTDICLRTSYFFCPSWLCKQIHFFWQYTLIVFMFTTTMASEIVFWIRL